MATLDEDDREFIRALIHPVSKMALRHDRALYGDDDTSTGISSRVGVLEGDRRRRFGESGVISAVVSGIVAGLGFFLGPRS